MSVATKKPAAKKTAVKKSPAKKIATKKPVVAKKAAKKVTATKRTTATDARIIEFCEEQFKAGVVHASAMRRNAKGTDAYTFSERFNPLAKSVIEKLGGKPKSEKPATTARKTGGAATVDRLNGMKAEYEALKKWKANGMKGDSPKTPLIDAKNAELDAKAARNAKQLATKKALASVHTAKKVAKKTAKKVAVNA